MLLNQSECCYRSQATNRVIENIEFWFEGVFLVLVGTFGLFGNATSIAVLSRNEMKNVFNRLLIFLSFIDTIMILFAIMNYSIINAFGVKLEFYNYMFPYFVNPVSNMALCASVFTVIAIAFERFMAVCFPLKYRSISCTQSVNTRVAKHVIPVIAISIFINLPKFFETELIEIYNKGTNTTEINFDITELRKNESYIYFYVHWVRLIGTGLIPMVVLIFLNTNIYIKIRSTKKLQSARKRIAVNSFPLKPIGKSLVSCPTRDNKQSNIINNNVPTRRDVKMALILSLIVVLFFFSHLPRIVLNLNEFMMLADIRSCGEEFCPPVWFMCMVPVSHFALVINSSINILIYCSVGDNFMSRLLTKKTKEMTTATAAGIPKPSHTIVQDGECQL